MRRDNIVLGIGVAMFVSAISLPAMRHWRSGVQGRGRGGRECLQVVRYLAPDGTAEDLTTGTSQILPAPGSRRERRRCRRCRCCQ